MGFYISGHPLSHYRRILPRLTSHSTASFEEEADIPEEIRVAGVIADFQMKKTKKDERMAVFQLEDLTGRVEVVVYAEPYKRYYHVLQEGSLVWIKGHYQLDGETHKIYLSHILPLEEAAQKLAKEIRRPAARPPPERGRSPRHAGSAGEIARRMPGRVRIGNAVGSPGGPPKPRAERCDAHGRPADFS